MIKNIQIAKHLENNQRNICNIQKMNKLLSNLHVKILCNFDNAKKINSLNIANQPEDCWNN
jgi:hypothetical protein